jgi:hypothetical protein
MDLNLRNIIIIIIASFTVGWFSNIAGYIPDYNVSLIIKVTLALFWVAIFLISMDVRDLFHGPDFMEVLAAFFFPYIIAVNLSWQSSTILLVISISVGLVVGVLLKYNKIAG